MSLNPPVYAEGENQAFSIDYGKVREITTPATAIPKLKEKEESGNINDEEINE